MSYLSLKQIQEILNRISFAPSGIRMHKEGNVQFEAKETPDGFLIRCSFWRPDTQTGKEGTGYGRWYHTPLDSSEKAIVMAAWLSFEQVVKHEMMECFLYRNTRIFDPHKSLEELAYPKKMAPDRPGRKIIKTFIREDLANEVHFVIHIKDPTEHNEGYLKVIWNFADGNVFYQSLEHFEVFEQHLPDFTTLLDIGVKNAANEHNFFTENDLYKLLNDAGFVDKTEKLSEL